MPKLLLTDRNVQSAKAPVGKRVEIFDMQEPGLILRVGSREEADMNGTPRVVTLKSWSFRYRTADGTQRRATIGLYPDHSLADAREAAATIRKASRAGGDPVAEEKRARAKAALEPLKTFGDVAEAYFKFKAGSQKASTWTEGRRLYDKRLAPSLAELPIEDVDARTVQALLDRVAIDESRKVTANRLRTLMGAIFNYGARKGRVALNPVRNVDPAVKEKARQRVLRHDELKTLWKALGDPSGLRKPPEDGKDEGERVHVSLAVGKALQMILLTLCRRAEASGMAVAELSVDQERVRKFIKGELPSDQGIWSSGDATWTIPGTRTKNGRDHVVPLVPRATRLIEEALKLANEAGEKLSPFVFPSPRDPSKPITPAALSHALRDMLPAIGIEDAHPHDFRRTGASLLASSRGRISPFIIGRLLNHTTEKGGAAAVTTGVYALYEYEAEKRQALVRWEAILLEIVGERKAESNVVELRAG